jgi:hypothetical protein
MKLVKEKHMVVAIKTPFGEKSPVVSHSLAQIIRNADPDMGQALP